MVAPTLRRYDALVVTSLIWFLAKFLRYAFPPLFEPLQGTYGVSNATIGAAFTGFMLAYALMQFPSGLLADRFGAVRVIAGGAALAAAGALAVVLGAGFVVLVLAMVVMGAGTGAHKTVSVSFLARVYPSRPGRALGTFDTIGTFGGVVAPVAVAGVLAAGVAAVGWRTIFLAGCLVGFALAGAMLTWVSEGSDGDGEEVEDRSPTLREYAEPFRQPRLATFVAATLCFGFVYNGLVAFLPLYLTRELGLTSAMSSLLYGLLFVVSVVQLGTGELSDRMGRLPVILVTLVVCGAGLLGLLGLDGPGPTVAGVPALVALSIAGIGIGGHGYRPVRGAYLTAILPESLTGGGLGVIRTLLMAAGAVAPAVVGWVADAAGFRAAFAILLVAEVAAVAIVALLLVAGRTRS